MDQNVIVLNADYAYINAISWQKAIILLYKGIAETVKESSRIVSNVDKSVQFIVPKVIKLVNLVTKIFKNKIPYSKYNVFIRDEYTCQFCGVKLKKRECTIDHVVPKVKGGLSSWNNCVCACKRCNNLKGDKDMEDTPYQFKRVPKRPSVSDFIRLKSKEVSW